MDPDPNPEPTVRSSHKFVSDVVWLGFAQVWLHGVDFAILALLSQGSSPKIYGFWAQINVTIRLLFPILALRFDAACIRFMAAQDRAAAVRTMLPMGGLAALLSLLALVMAVIYRHQLSSVMFAESGHGPLVVLTFCWLAAETIYFILVSFLRAQREIKQLSLLKIVLSSLKIPVVIGATYYGYGLSQIVLLIVISEVLLLFVFFRLLLRGIPLKGIDLRPMGDYVRYSLPLIPNIALFWIMESSDRYFITYYLDLESTGIYAAAYMLGSVITLFSLPLNSIIFPAVSKYWAENEMARVKKYLDYSIKLIIMFCLPGAVGLYILAQPLLLKLTSASFACSPLIILIIALGKLFYALYENAQTVFHLLNRTPALLLVSIVIAAVKMGLNFALIPTIGIMGAALATLGTYALLAVVTGIVAFVTVRSSLDLAFLGRVSVATLIMWLGLRFFVITSVTGIILGIVLGAIIYSAMLLLLRTFSDEEKKFMLTLVPDSIRKRILLSES
jgi:O-antigen/teichoic acid export membrane protein